MDNATTLPSTPSLHSHKLDDISVAESLLEGVASAAAAGKLEASTPLAADSAAAETPLQTSASAPNSHAPAAPRKLLASAPSAEAAAGRPQLDPGLSKSMQEKLQISEDSGRIARVKKAFAGAVRCEFKRLMAKGGVSANEAANLALKHAIAQQQAQA